MMPRPKRARVYLHREGSRLIVAVVHHTPDGICFEADGPLSLATWNDDDLGESVKLALEQSGIRAGKQSEGAALKVSGEPSIRAFQSRFIQIDLSGAGEADLVYRIEGAPASETDLRVLADISGTASPAEFARLINRVYQACRDRRF